MMNLMKKVNKLMKGYINIEPEVVIDEAPVVGSFMTPNKIEEFKEEDEDSEEDSIESIDKE
jgi:hypothetical protein